MAEELSIELDIETMTIGEIESLEEITGSSWRNIDWENMPTKVMRALAFIAGRRQRPDFTIEDAGNVTLASFIREKAAPAPTGAEGGGADPTRAPSGSGGE